MSTQQTVLTQYRRKEPVLHTIWGTEIGYISQLYELQMLDIYTKRRTFDPCGTKLAHLFQKNHRNGGKQEKTTKIHEFVINV